MKNIKLFSSLLFLVLSSTIYSQEKMDIQGAIIIANSEDPTPEPGTIRWSGTDFEGWNGSEWLSMTGGKKYVKDVDNNSYEIVTIGAQTWMSENLRTSRYNNGVLIPLVTDPGDWVSSSPGYTWFDNGDYGTPDYGAPEYGALYNYYVVASTNIHNVCPTGWHVPSDAEWTTLTDHLGGLSVAGGKMKETGLAHWNNPNTGSTNSSGFTGLPGGYRVPVSAYANIGNSGYWWSSESSGSNAFYRSLQYNDDDVLQGSDDKGFGFSVRCIKD